MPAAHGALTACSKPHPRCSENKLAAAVPAGSAKVISPLVTPRPKFASSLVPPAAEGSAFSSAKAMARKAAPIMPREATAGMDGAVIKIVATYIKPHIQRWPDGPSRGASN